MGSKEETERKRRHVNNNVSSSPKNHPSSADDKKVDAAELQLENHKLAQQLEVQRNEIHALEVKFQDLKQKQRLYDESLAAVQDAWEELMMNVELLFVRANAPIKGLGFLQPSCCPQESLDDAYVSPENIFLLRLLHSGAIKSNGTSNGTLSVERLLEQRQSFTLRLVEDLVEAVESQNMKNDDLYKKTTTSEDYKQVSQSMLEDMRREIEMLKSVMSSLDLRQCEMLSEIKSCQDHHSKDEVALNRLKGDLEETLADLETSRRKLAALRYQKDSHFSVAGSISGSRDTFSRESKELETALEEAKNLASQRLDELKEVQKEKLNISEEILKLQESLSNENIVMSSPSYIALLDEAQVLKAELERAQSTVHEKEAEHDHSLQLEREAMLKAEAGEAAQKVNDILKARISELESNLEQCVQETGELQARLEEEALSSEAVDEVAEFKVIVSSLHKEMRMMQQQLNQHKEAACGSYLLRAEVQSLKSVLERKTSECKKLADKVADQSRGISTIKDEVRLLRESEEELRLILEMYGRESTDSSEARDLKQAECRAWAQVERLKTALDEHTLELRVKEAIQAESACQQKLATAEADIAELRQSIDASDRDALDANDVLRMKSEEGDVYLAEIEMIGQAYEDMQTQNQRLLQQISERDDYNLKLIFESFKTKQIHASLIEEKQSLSSRLQHINSLGECYKERAARLDEQSRTYSEQLSKALEDTRLQTNALEQARWKLAEAENDLTSSRYNLQSAHRELENQRSKMMEADAELDKERFERRRLQEELVLLNAKASLLNLHNDATPLVEKLQEEIKEYKAILTCSICHDRPKEVVITKCFHLFCNRCVQKALDTRHRKCPRCGAVFGQNDVRTVYI